MNKIFSSIIIFLIGLASGYFFIIFAGYTAYWSSGLITGVVNILKEYEILYMVYLISGIVDSLVLLLTAIPIFLISGLLLVYFIKRDRKFVRLFSSIGLLIIPAWSSGIPSIYCSMYFNAFIVLAIPLLVNLFFISKTSNIIDTPKRVSTT